MEKNAAYYVKKLGMSAHPEGGYFKEVYRSDEALSELPKRFNGARSIATSIYYLLQGNDQSHFHRIKSDETWHFYAGSRLLLHMISPLGDYQLQKVGRSLEDGDVLQFTVPHGFWFASELEDKNSFALLGCSVAPGFDFQDFELAEKEPLSALCPEKVDLIEGLTLK